MGGASGGVHNIISTNGTDNTNGKFRTTTRLNVLPSPPPSPSGSRLSLGDDGPNSFNHLKGSWGPGKATRHSVACGGSEGGSMGAAHDPTSLSHTRRGGSTRLLRHPLGAEDCARKPPELDPHPPVPVLLHGEWQPARAEGFSEHGTCVGQRFCAPGSGQDYGGDRDRSPKPRGSRPYHLKPFGGGPARRPVLAGILPLDVSIHGIPGVDASVTQAPVGAPESLRGGSRTEVRGQELKFAPPSPSRTDHAQSGITPAVRATKCDYHPPTTHNKVSTFAEFTTRCQPSHNDVMSIRGFYHP